MTMKRMVTVILGGMLSLSFMNLSAQQAANGGRWQPTFTNLAGHSAPEWLLDAKIGIQYVGAPSAMNDRDYFDWLRSAQRVRELGYEESTADLRKYITEFGGKRPYAFVQNKVEHLDQVFAAYRRTGARFLVSMIEGAYPGTEGLRMTPREIAAARQAGFRVGVHYNFIRRSRIPSIGDPGYLEYYQKQLKDAVQEAQADFMFFDGSQLTPSAYLKTPELLAWYFNWADANGKEVWVNDDLGIKEVDRWGFGDVCEFEGCTMTAVPKQAWMDWDILRNEWNCWVNEYGIHQLTGEKWKWEYHQPEDLLHILIYNVSRGGCWLVQMDNTKQAWENMNAIGAWLAVNGAAIYATRPLLAPQEDAASFPSWAMVRSAKRPGGEWAKRFSFVLDMARDKGPIYFTKKGNAVFAIHWGWPGEKLRIPGITAQPGSAIRMLGVDEDLKWNQSGSDIEVSLPKAKPCDYAYSFKISIPTPRECNSRQNFAR